MRRWQTEHSTQIPPVMDADWDADFMDLAHQGSRVGADRYDGGVYDFMGGANHPVEQLERFNRRVERHQDAFDRLDIAAWIGSQRRVKHAIRLAELRGHSAAELAETIRAEGCEYRG